MSGRRSCATGATSTSICRRPTRAASAIRSSTCRTARTCRIRRPRLPGTWDLRGDDRSPGVARPRGDLRRHPQRRPAAGSREYSPFPDPRHGGGDADAYLAFLVETLKPRIDRMFNTRRDRDVDRDPRIVDGRPGQPLRLLPLPVGVRPRRRDEPVDLVRAGRDRRFHPTTRACRAGASTSMSAPAKAPARCATSAVSAGCWSGKDFGAGAARLAEPLRPALGERRSSTSSALRYVEDAGARHTEAAWAWRLEGALEFLLS